MKKQLLVSVFILFCLNIMMFGQSTRIEIPIVKNGEQVSDSIFIEDEEGNDVFHSVVTFDLSSDDAEEIHNLLSGEHVIDDLNDDDLDVGWEGEADEFNVVNVGLRFQDVTIPKGATIINSYLEVTSHEVKTTEDTAFITIYGEASDNAETFTEEALITSRPLTEDSIVWEANKPWGLWTVERTPDISTIVQGIVDRDGWSSGNSIAIIMKGQNQGPTEKEPKREFEAFENISDPEDGGDGQHHPDRVPKLIVQYTTEDANVQMSEVPVVKNGEQVSDSIFIEDEEGNDVFHSVVTFDLSSDDAEEIHNLLSGEHVIDDLNDDDLDVGWEGEADEFNVVNVGIRFQDIQIPNNAEIYSAYVEMTSHEVKTVDDTAFITIFGEASDNAETFTEEALITSRTLTQDSVYWEANKPWGLWTVERTPDISSIVQEIVSRDGWASGNALAVILKGQNQGPTEKEPKREFEAFENISDPEDGGDGQHHADRVPKLVVYYNAGGATSVVNSYGISNSIKIYPNPVYNQLKIELTNNDVPADLEILDITGKKVESINNINSGNIELDVSDVTSGIYFIKVIQENIVHTQKVIIK